MPYSVEKRDGKFCVVKPDGKSMGCHADRKRAMAQMRALYANEPDAGKDIKELMQASIAASDLDQKTRELALEDEKGFADVPVDDFMSMMFPPVTFDDLDDSRERIETEIHMRQLLDDYHDLINNIVFDMFLEDKPAALVALATEFSSRMDKAVGIGDEDDDDEEKEKAVWSTKYVNDLPDSAFLYVEPGEKQDGKTTPRSKRHFPYKDASGKIDTPHLRNAIARIPQSNAPGLTPEKKKRLQARARKMLGHANKEGGIRGWIEQTMKEVAQVLNIDAGSKEVRDDPFMVWKDKDGQYRWLAVYSNKWRDQDFPPEILSSQAHKDFIARVEKGEDPYPELWHWHVPGTTWGKSDWLCFTDEGFALASGYILPGHEKEAESLMGLKGVRTSHGMPLKSIQRSADDPTVIVRYSSVEISDLPAEAAANMLTDFTVLEVPMPIPNDKKDYLRRAGLDDSTIADIEAKLEGKARAADLLGFDQKSAEPPQVSAEPQKQETTTEETSTTTGADSKEVTTTQSMPESVVAATPAVVPSEEMPPSRKELAEVLAPLLQSVQILTERVAGLEKSREEKPAPVASQTVLLRDLLGLSPIGSKSAQVDLKQTEVVAKVGPKEAQKQQRHFIPLIDKLTGGGDAAESN